MKTLGLIALFTVLTGCALQQPLSIQTITPSMVYVPPEPLSPDPETADQRDVALYLIALRAWGQQMALQLQAVSDLLEESQDNNE